MRRREFIALVGAALATCPLAARAQQPRKVWRIGFLSGLSRPASIESSMWGGFLQGMRELGYVECHPGVFDGDSRADDQRSQVLPKPK